MRSWKNKTRPLLERNFQIAEPLDECIEIRYVGPQQAGGLGRLKLIGAQRRRQKPELRSSILLRLAAPLDAAGARKKNQQLKACARGHTADARVEFPFFCGEIGARGEVTLDQATSRNAHGGNLAAAMFAEMNHLERLLDLQWARFAVRAEAIEIEDAISDVRLFLDFAERSARAERVDRAR